MSFKISRKQNHVAWGLFILAALLAFTSTGCSKVTLISNYDEQIDQSATDLQKEMDRFLTNLEYQAGTPEADYENNIDFYRHYLIEMRALLIRVQSHPDNQITEEQVRLMTDNLNELKAAHESGQIEAEAIQVFRDLFNQGWGAIIKLEIAKKRGED